MKLTTFKDVITHKTIYTLTVNESDMVSAEFTEYDRKLFDECDKSKKLSDKLLAINTIAKRIEEAR